MSGASFPSLFAIGLIFITESLDALFCNDPSSFSLLRKEKDNVPPHSLARSLNALGGGGGCCCCGCGVVNLLSLSLSLSFLSLLSLSLSLSLSFAL